MSVAMRSGRKDLWMKRDLMIEHLKGLKFRVSFLL